VGLNAERRDRVAAPFLDSLLQQSVLSIWWRRNIRKKMTVLDLRDAALVEAEPCGDIVLMLAALET
jgi:hypothetical protein